MSRSPEFCVVVAPGTNCDRETIQAINHFGGVARRAHIADLKAGTDSFDDAQGLIIPGGFSYGDIVRAGAIFASDILTHSPTPESGQKRLSDSLNEFASSGKPIIGTCNGFQVLLEAGLLPGGQIDPSAPHDFTLDFNRSLKFENRWAKIRIEDSVCKLTTPEDVGQVLPLESAHAEGRLTTRDDRTFQHLLDNRQVVLRFCDDLGQPTEAYPDNPNGSAHGITGICDPNGNVFGMMPHDERLARPEHYPNWRRDGVVIPPTFLAKFIRGAINYAGEM